MKENKMKPKRIQKHDRPSWQGKGGTGGDKTTLSQATAAVRVHHPAQVKPFAGKVFYLDLPSNRIVETLERDIKELGGTVEKFFSKEIKYLVSNKREAKYVQCLRQDSPVPSPDSGQSSPHPRSNPHRPGSHGDNMKSRSQGQTDAFVTSRGKSLVERVVKEQKRVQMNKILSNALEWGVKILYIDDVMAYVQKKKKTISGQIPVTTAVKTNVKTEPAAKQSFQKCKGGRITKPFVKVEDSSRHYRPIYLNMPNMPELNLKTVPPCSPFCFEDKDNPGNRQRANRGAKGSASEERAHAPKRNKNKKRGGYCECCMIKYENLTTHLQSDRHKAFSKSEEYFVVDRLVSTMHCNFIHIKSKIKRPKCSVLIAPGPCGKTEPSHRGDLDTTETIKEEQYQTVDGQRGESYSGHNLKISSLPGSAPLIQRDGDSRNVFTSSDRSKHKSLARKRLCRQNSLTSFTQKAEQAESPQQNMETAPSRGEGLASFPSRVTQVDPEGQISYTDMNSLASPSHTINAQNELPSGCLNDTTNHQEQSDMIKDCLLFEAVQEGNISPERMTGNNLSDKVERNPPTQSCSPVRKIQRRVRVYKRKRRKLDTHVMCQEHEKPNDIRDDSLLTLRELFQSSDDMDVEFLGFVD
ncbi:protein DBF4 homolog A [Scomber scombrus]|uniref:Protein DBF4 homolog A n=1 Tax=Scomber scombrus TaxID=13677 RepID=A0AAV1NMB1_SCOSC|nr:protein DBF4 homolog A [Scomber scombrus]